MCQKQAFSACEKRCIFRASVYFGNMPNFAGLWCPNHLTHRDSRGIIRKILSVAFIWYFVVLCVTARLVTITSLKSGLILSSSKCSFQSWVIKISLALQEHYLAIYDKWQIHHQRFWPIHEKGFNKSILTITDNPKFQVYMNDFHTPWGAIHHIECCPCCFWTFEPLSLFAHKIMSLTLHKVKPFAHSWETPPSQHGYLLFVPQKTVPELQ